MQTITVICITVANIKLLKTGGVTFLVLGSRNKRFAKVLQTMIEVQFVTDTVFSYRNNNKFTIDIKIAFMAS